MYMYVIDNKLYSILFYSILIRGRDGRRQGRIGERGESEEERGRGIEGPERSRVTS